MKFQPSPLATKYLMGKKGIEIGASAHNDFFLDTINVDLWNESVFTSEQSEFGNEPVTVDVIAPAHELPFEDQSYDFVLASHVIEHLWDPMAAIREWCRVSREWVFIICPHPDALASDRGKKLTTLDDLIIRADQPAPEPNPNENVHLSRWTWKTFVEMIAFMGIPVEKVQDPDDKVGNGFAVILDVR